MKCPKQVTIIGIIFIIAGSLSVIQTIYGLFHEHLYLNFSVLMLPVGFGLLKGKSSSRSWAKFWIGMLSVLFALLLILYPFLGDSYSITWFNEPLTGMKRHFMAVGFPVIMLLIARWMWSSLTLDSVGLFSGDDKKEN